MNKFNPDEQLQPLNLTWSDSLHNYIVDLNTASPYLNFHESISNENEWVWIYNSSTKCIVSDDVEDDALFTLEQAVVSYIRWSSKQLESEDLFDIEEEYSLNLGHDTEEITWLL